MNNNLGNCPFNVGVTCDTYNHCVACGFNHKVAERRVERLRTAAYTGTLRDLSKYKRARGRRYNEAYLSGLRRPEITLSQLLSEIS